MKDFLPTLIALIALTVLGTAYFYSQGTNEIENEKKLWFVSAHNINKIKISNEKGSFLIQKSTMADEDGKFNWNLLLPSEDTAGKTKDSLDRIKDIKFSSSGYKTERQLVDTLINSITCLTASRVLSQNMLKEKDHGLSAPRAIIEWESANGKSGKLNVGNFIEFSSSCYINTSDTTKVMTVLLASIAPLLESAMKLVNRIVLPINPDRVSAISVNRTKESFHLQKNTNNLFILSYKGQKPCPAHPPAVDYLINQLVAMKADAVLSPEDLKKSGTSLKKIGLDRPQISVKITMKEPLSTIFIGIGNRVENEEDMVHLMVKESSSNESSGDKSTFYLYKIRAEQLLVLSSPGDEYKSTTLFAIPGTIYDYFVATKNNKNAPPQNIKSRKLGSRWETGNEFKENLDKVRAITFYSGQEVPLLKNTGLSPPAYSIGFSYSTNPLNRYEIGQDTGQDVVYILLRDQSMVAVDKTILPLFAKLFEDHYAYNGPQLPDKNSNNGGE